MSDTPRTDQVIAEALGEWRPSDSGIKFIELARQLERELAEARKPPPCQHTQRCGRVDGENSQWWCQQCGQSLDGAYVSIYGAPLGWLKS